MWIKVQDDQLYAMLRALPRPWPDAAVLVWLLYCSRCIDPGGAGIKANPVEYWVPEWASAKARKRAQARRFPGRASVESVAGVGSGTAQRLLKTWRVNSNQSVGHSGNHSGKSAKTPTASTSGSPSHSVTHSATHSKAATPKPQKRPSAAHSRAANSCTDKRRTLLRESRRRNRSGRNLATAPAPIAAGFKPTAQQIDGSWAHIRKLARSHPDTMPRSLHPRSSKHMALLRAVRRLGDGDQRIGWRRAVELRQRACMVPGEGATPEEWKKAYIGDTP